MFKYPFTTFKHLFSIPTSNNYIMSSTARIITRQRSTTTTTTPIIVNSPVVKKKTTNIKNNKIKNKKVEEGGEDLLKAPIEKKGFKPLDSKKRCFWISLTKDEEYIHYHDNEWGKENRDSQRLFEKICLEAQQAGLSWITVLKKRQNYRDSFYNFDPKLIVDNITPEVIENSLMKNTGLIRNRLKLQAIVDNARAYLKMRDQDKIEFSTFIWSFVNNKSSIGQRVTGDTSVQGSRPLTRNEVSDAMSVALKKKGFKFIGTTTLYAFMQSVGIINDHCKDCEFNPINQKKNI
ncbi:DNA-3-methyladenine glycosylase I [Dictyostelium discoideum AX4]|uniref:DNA-3-methyladenine glycosylase I n=1 Tax=Dictyostelium discoideum TaxID=44689 RepID=Q1ZXP8_DICDI|nr:DNA-3-methyladenine glycosylase I [Dictyostelium discoideum AX4]EAS66940.1 DNA-3-methyladenine glycosylase I [Dictyostelium discoideum AX4]|eukprot:XP_001134476.1 DNA-3-methyladenine glycosylase I [Dictyostelium discoideum AX4]